MSRERSKKVGALPARCLCGAGTRGDGGVGMTGKGEGGEDISLFLLYLRSTVLEGAGGTTGQGRSFLVNRSAFQPIRVNKAQESRVIR